MSESTISLVEDLVARFPNLEPLFREHVSDNFGAVLPHLFFGDLTRYVVDLFLESRDEHAATAQSERELSEILDTLERAFEAGDPEIDELISDSFLEHLPRPNEEAGWKIRLLLGPQLSKRLNVIG